MIKLSFFNLFFSLYLLTFSLSAQGSPIVAVLTDTIPVKEIIFQGDTLTGIWVGTDKYQIEENVLTLGSNGWYTLAEQDIALKEDSLGFEIELGLYVMEDRQLRMYPLSGKNIYQTYYFPMTEFSKDKMTLEDHEHGNAGKYIRQGQPKFSKAQIDFFLGIDYRVPLLNTYWKDKEKEEEWYFLSPDYVMFKKEGVYNGHARFYFDHKTLVVVNSETGQPYFEAKLMTQSKDNLLLNDEKNKEVMIFKSIGQNGLTAKETIIYKNYLKRIHSMEIETANSIKGELIRIIKKYKP